MDEQQDLNQLVNRINTRDDFVGFVRALANDLHAHPAEWENSTLEQYLQALWAWSEDMDGYFKNTRQPFPENMNWRLVGQILLAAKFYE